MHDAAEAYIGDITRPVKKFLCVYDPLCKAVEWPSISEIEIHLLAVIAQGLNLPTPPPKAFIELVDYTLLVTEIRDLMPFNEDIWSSWTGKQHQQPLEKTIVPWNWRVAEENFLYVYQGLRTQP